MTEASDRVAARLAEIAESDGDTPSKWATFPPADVKEFLSDYARLQEALKPFARYLDVLETMGGNTPRSGTYCGVTSSSGGDAEITIEHFQAARQALSHRTGEPS